MPSKIFGQYKEEQVPQINYLPYTAQMASMMLQGANNLTSGIAEGIKRYNENKDISAVNDAGVQNVLPHLDALTKEITGDPEKGIAPNKEYAYLVPTLQSLHDTTSKISGMNPKAGAGALAGVIAQMNGLGDQMKSMDRLRTSRLVQADALNPEYEDVKKPAPVDISNVDWDFGATHDDNLNFVSDFWDKNIVPQAESLKAKGHNIELDKTRYMIGVLKSKRDELAKGSIEGIDESRREQMLAIFDADIERLGEEGTGIDTIMGSENATFTMRDAQGNPVSVSVPTKQPVSNAPITAPVTNANASGSPAPALTTPATTDASGAPSVTPRSIDANVGGGEASGIYWDGKQWAQARPTAPAPAKVAPTATVSAPVVAPAKVAPEPAVQSTASAPAQAPIAPPKVEAPAQAQSPKKATSKDPNRTVLDYSGEPIPEDYFTAPVFENVEVDPETDKPVDTRKLKDKVGGAILNYIKDKLNGVETETIEGKSYKRVPRPRTPEEIEQRKQEAEQNVIDQQEGDAKENQRQRLTQIEGKLASSQPPKQKDWYDLSGFSLVTTAYGQDGIPIPPTKEEVLKTAGVTESQVNKAVGTKATPATPTTAGTIAPVAPSVQTPSTKVSASQAQDTRLDEQRKTGRRLKLAGRSLTASGLSAYADRYLDDLENVNPESLNMGTLTAWGRKNPVTYKSLTAGANILATLVPVKYITGVTTLKKVADEAKAGNATAEAVHKLAQKLIDGGMKEEQAMSQAVDKVNKGINMSKNWKITGATIAAGTTETALSFIVGDIFNDKFDLPNIDMGDSGEMNSDLVKASEQFIDDMKSISGRSSGWFGYEWGKDLEKDAEYKQLAKKKILDFKQQMTDIRKRSLDEIVDIAQNGIRKELPATAPLAPNKNLNLPKGIHTETQVNVGTDSYRRQFSMDEKKNNLKKFMIDKYGFIPSSFETTYGALHPEAGFKTMEANGIGYYFDGKEWKPEPVSKAEKQKTYQEWGQDQAYFFGVQKPDGTVAPREFIPDSGVYLKGIFQGTPTELSAFRTEYKATLNGKRVAKRLFAINEDSGESINPSLVGEAKGLLPELMAGLRTMIIGVGTVSNFEQQMIKDVVADPTAFLSLEAIDRAKLLVIMQRFATKTKQDPYIYGLEVTEKADPATTEAQLRSKHLNSGVMSKAQKAYYEKNPDRLAEDKKNGLI